jgi:AcrR family transcriptional regulator
MSDRQTPTRRRVSLLEVALRLAAAQGWQNLTRAAIAQSAGVSEALVTVRLGSMEQLKAAVMRAAIRDECVPVVAEGLALRDKQACRAGVTLKRKAAAWVAQ